MTWDEKASVDAGSAAFIRAGPTLQESECACCVFKLLVLVSAENIVERTEH